MNTANNVNDYREVFALQASVKIGRSRSLIACEVSA